MTSFTTSLELKTVDVGQRIISGYAASHSNIDRVRDVIDPAASQKAVARIKHPSDIPVFIGHDQSMLPVGIPQKIEAHPRGLYTETLIKPGPVGDDLLHTARFMQDHGLPLGMSIGYRTKDSRHETTARGRVRRIMDYDLKEYSFASPHATASPEAHVTGVKARRKALAEGADAAGGALVPADNNDGAYPCQACIDGDEDDCACPGCLAGGECVCCALLGRDEDQEEDGGDKTMPKVMKEQHDSATMGDGDGDEDKAEWSTAQVNDLPDSAFLYVEPGEKDEDGKRVPRSKRHFPYKDASGKVDLPHLRNAIARIPQSNAPGLNKDAVQARARALLEQHGGGGDKAKTLDLDAQGWQDGAPLAIRALAYRLMDLSETVAAEQKAMALLGEDTKGGHRVRQPARDELKTVEAEIARLRGHAERIDAGEDGRARVAWLRAQFALTEA